jgi:hypothetical protein
MLKIFSKVPNTEQKMDISKAKERLLQQRKVFIKEMLEVLDEAGVEPEIKELILTKMVCFGPTAIAGTNILVSRFVKPGQSFL